MPTLKSGWLLRIDEVGTLNRFEFLRACVMLIELFFYKTLADKKRRIKLERDYVGSS